MVVAVRLLFMRQPFQFPSGWLEAVRLMSPPPFASLMLRSFHHWPLQSVGTQLRIITMLQRIFKLSNKHS